MGRVMIDFSCTHLFLSCAWTFVLDVNMHVETHRGEVLYLKRSRFPGVVRSAIGEQGWRNANRMFLQGVKRQGDTASTSLHLSTTFAIKHAFEVSTMTVKVVEFDSHCLQRSFVVLYKRISK